jgi:hypothetical protein
MDQLEKGLKKISIEDQKNIIVPSQYHTKEWRKKQKWYDTGKRNECEKYQIRVISSVFNNIEHTHERVNLNSGEIQCVRYPFKREDAFDWTENFDGKTEYNGLTVYFNFKFVVGAGGAQTRTLREVYHYIKKQEGYIFINILDGDESYKKYKYIRHLMTLKKYVGDTYNFPVWYAIVFVINLPTDVKNIIMQMCI